MSTTNLIPTVEASRALLRAKGKMYREALSDPALSPHIRATESAIVAHAEGQAKARKGLGLPVPSESASQQAVIRWWKLYHREAGIPERLLFAVPLQAGRTARNGARMKAEGARAGCLDLWLVVPRGGFTGCAIEMKRAPVHGGNRKGYLSDEQTAFISDLQDAGWQVCVCYSTDEAVTAISDYCNLPIKNEQD